MQRKIQPLANLLVTRQKYILLLLGYYKLSRVCDCISNVNDLL